MNIFSFLTISGGPLGRILLSQIAPTYLHIDRFGHSLDFLNYQGLPSIILRFFEENQIRSARILMENVFPERVEEGTAGVLNTLYIAEAYAMYGPLGVIIGTIYVAIFLQLIYMIFLKSSKNPLVLALFVYFTVNIPRTIVGGFSDFIINPIWIIIVSMISSIYIAYLILKFLKIKFVK
jgi:hypothetical protein